MKRKYLYFLFLRRTFAKVFETAIMVLEKIEMVKKKIKLIAVDMDGTFLDEKASLMPSVLSSYWMSWIKEEFYLSWRQAIKSLE